jgi:D-alanine-D-alanine ligase
LSAAADFGKVAVLLGGRSAEREVSLMSGKGVLKALRSKGVDAHAFDPAERDLGDLKREGFMRCFIALHGRGGEDGTIQGLLELLGIPYTGSGVLASALAMDKPLSKRIFRAEGLPTPVWRDFRLDNCTDAAAIAADIESALGLPVVIKPACEGSTIGVSIARRSEELPAALECAARYGPRVLAEEFVVGAEITAGILGNRNPQVLPLVEIVPRGGFYDYEAKYTPGATEEIVPARVDERTAQRAREIALASYEALGCRGFARVDLIAGAQGPVVLELNTIPGLTETSLVPRAAQAAGIDFTSLLDRIIELALNQR